MIDAKELRIGNWVILDWDGDKRPQKIAEIRMNLIEVRDWDEQFSYFSLYPIPLTAEILLKCGFKYGKTGKKKDDSFVQFWDIRTSDHKHSFTNGFYFSIVRWWKGNKPQEFTFSHHEIRSDCKYVHQLQNLFYALTQKELEIKL